MHRVLQAAPGDGGAVSTLTATPAPALNGMGDGSTAPPAGGAPPTPPAGGGTPAWYDTFKDEGTKAWVKSLNLPDPEAVAIKAHNLEKYVGADKAGRGVVKPKPDATPEEWQKFYRESGGVPEKAEQYSLPKTLDPKVQEVLVKDPMFAKFQAYAHKVGMPQVHFAETLQWFANESKAMMDGKDAEFEAKIEKDMTDLKTEWASNWDQNIELSRRAVKTFLPADKASDFISRVEGAIGTAETYRFFHNIGKAMGEDAFVQGNTPNAMGGGMTPEGAKLRIGELKQDPAWSRRFAEGDADCRLEWTRLHKIAFPDQVK
jgi:hypothetical protein